MIKNKINKKSELKPKEWLPANVAILGAGKSGIAAAKFLIDKDVSVFISETCGDKKMDFILASNSIADKPHEANGHTEKILECDLIICSPGIPSNLKLLEKARKNGIPVWSEIELAYRHSKAPFIAVTGSTGKSTTISLIGSILQSSQKEHVVAGNIGIPLISVAPQISQSGFVAAEISSFQLENIDLFKPNVVAILNLLKNHLDRYENENAYYNAKKEIIRNMSLEDTLIVNAHDHLLVEWAKNQSKKVRIVYFGENIQGVDCVWFDNSIITIRYNGKEEEVVDCNLLKIKGKHNIENVCTAIAAACISGIDKMSIAHGLSSFTGLSHRLEFVREVNGVKYYNDSKATTAESVKCAVDAFQDNVHLIAGGKDKGCDFSIVSDSIKKNVKTVTLIGNAANRIAKEWKKLADINFAESLEDALGIVNNKVQYNDVVVFSPGCSSFDMFKNFEERGDIFKKLVNSIDH